MTSAIAKVVIKHINHLKNLKRTFDFLNLKLIREKGKRYRKKLAEDLVIKPRPITKPLISDKSRAGFLAILTEK